MRLRDGRAQLGAQPIDGRRDARHGSVRPRGIVRLAFALEEIGAQDEADEIGGVGLQRASNRGFLGRLVAEVPADDGEMNPLLRIGSVDVDEALEGDARGRHVTPAKRALADRGQRARMARVELENPVPEPEGIVLATRLDGTESLRLECVDFGQSLLNILHYILSALISTTRASVRRTRRWH